MKCIFLPQDIVTFQESAEGRMAQVEVASKELKDLPGAGDWGDLGDSLGLSIETQKTKILH